MDTLPTRSITALRNTIQTLTSYLLPTQCLLCGCTLQRELICLGCRMDLPYLSNQPLCKQCNLFLPGTGDFCGHCLHQPPAFSHSFIPFAYQHPLNHLIHKFKYRRNLTCGKLLGILLADHLKNTLPLGEQDLPDIIISAPIHWTRRWQRGFNQAEVLGFYLANALQLPFAPGLIQRIQRTPAQKELSRDERQRNLRKAFSIPAKNLDLIRGKRIAIVDDVVTTTATVRELSQLLRKKGAADVHIWALARTMEK